MRLVTRNLLLGAVAGTLAISGQAFAQTGATVDARPTEPLVKPLTVPPEHPLATEDETATIATEPRRLSAGIDEIRLDELEDMEVYSIGGENIGEIDYLVRRGGELAAVTEINDTWFDWNDERVLVPLHMFERTDAGLRLPLTKAQADAIEEYVDEIEDQRVTSHDTVGDAYAAID